MLPQGQEVTWNEFKTAFRGHHIPEGLIERKLNEFLALNQGTKSVLQYAQAFNNLCQYAGSHADTDAKKMERFRRGLSAKLQDRLAIARTATYNELVNLAISQEDKMMAAKAEKKRKSPMAPAGMPNPKFRLVQNTPTANPQRPAQQGRWVVKPP